MQRSARKCAFRVTTVTQQSSNFLNHIEALVTAAHLASVSVRQATHHPTRRLDQLTRKTGLDRGVGSWGRADRTGGTVGIGIDCIEAMAGGGGGVFFQVASARITDLPGQNFRQKRFGFQVEQF